MSQPTDKYADTKWKEYSNIGMEIDKQQIEEMDCLYATFPDGLKIAYNSTCLTKVDRDSMKPLCFIMDQEDIDWLNSKKKNIPKDCLESCGNFQTHRPDKKMYIRYFRDLSGNEEPRVLVNDVDEIIRLVLHQQNTPIDSSDDRLVKFYSSWDAHICIFSNMFKSNYERLYSSMDMKSFKETLEKFDINKALITVVPDILYEFTTYEHNVEDHKHAIARSPQGSDMMYPSYAIYYIFQYFIYGVKWYKDYCKVHRNCKSDLKIKVLDVMDKYLKIDPTMFVSLEHVNAEVCHLVGHCTRKHQIEDLVALNIFDGLVNSENIPMNSYKRLCRDHNLPTHINFIRNRHKQEDTIPVWMAKMYYVIGQMQVFFAYTKDDLKWMIRTVLISKTPMEFRNDMKDVLDEIICTEEQVISESEEENESGDELTKNRLEKMREEAERRKQELQKKKDAKKNKGGKKENSVTKETKEVKKIAVQESDDVATSSQIMARKMTKTLMEGTENMSHEELIKKLEGVEVSLHFEKPESVDDSKVNVLSSSEVMEKKVKSSTQKSDSKNDSREVSENKSSSMEGSITKDTHKTEAVEIVSKPMDKKSKSSQESSFDSQVKCSNRGFESRITKFEEIKVTNNETTGGKTDRSNPENTHHNQLKKSESKVDSGAAIENESRSMERFITKNTPKKDKLETVSKTMDEINTSSKGPSSGIEKQSERKNTPREKEEEKRNDFKINSEESVTTKNESKCCPKCLQTSQMCNEAYKKLKITQEKLVRFEDKANKFYELENKMKEKDEDMKLMKKTNTDSEKELRTVQNELKKFELKEKRTHELEKKMKDTEKEMEQLKKHLQEVQKFKMMHKEAEEKLKESERERDNLKNAMVQLKKQEQKSGNEEQLEKDLLEKDRIIAQKDQVIAEKDRIIAEEDQVIDELRETNMRVTVRNEEQSQNIQNLLDRLMKPNFNGNQ